ncbi:hypothetical protein Tco_1475457 [Tanacetum coccineum]
MATTSPSTNIQLTMVELVKNEIDKDLVIEKRLREMCLELTEVHKKREKEIRSLGREPVTLLLREMDNRLGSCVAVYVLSLGYLM